jgi:large subunit ribosomal protein L18Ae
VKKIKTYRPEIHGDVAPVGVKRPNIREFLNGSIKFPLTHRIIRPALKRFRTTFTANRPTTFYS